MGRYHNHTVPNETKAYRQARDDLLAEELELRCQLEKVAELRRALPAGGAISEDYVYQGVSGEDVRLSELFSERSPELFIYNFIYRPGAAPCPVCTSFMDSLDGGVRHISRYFNIAIVAMASSDELRSWSDARGWRNLTLLSSGRNGFNRDYNAEDADGRQLMMLNAFRKTDDGIFHSWSFELFYAREGGGGDARHLDRIWPFLSIYDVTMDGRPGDWSPAYDYD